jgi:Spy/CpxP family protein refolding chaperone
MKKILTGMLAVMLFAGAAQAQENHKHEGKGRHGQFAKELNLTEDQKAKLKSIHEAERNEMQGLKNSSLSEEQLRAKRQEIQKKYREQSQAILTPAQKDQMEKMKDERKEKGEGKKQFSKGKKDKAQFQSLNLTQDQKERMAKLREEYKGRYESVRDNKSLSDEQRKTQMKALKEEQKSKMKSILTKEQQEKLQSTRLKHDKKSTK